MNLLALAMIVRDEAHSIEATLESVEGIADRVVIVDTGSVDGTLDILRGYAPLVEIHQAPFVDFATTRNLALDLAEPAAPFVLMLSGGETLREIADLRAFLERARMQPDGAYYVRMQMGPCVWQSARLSRSGAGWRYVGAVHEVLVGPDAATPTPSRRAPGLIVHEKQATDIERDRRRWRRDVDLLWPGAERGEPRALFYLAQTYHCLGDVAEAIRWYERRLAAGGWAEEMWEAAYRRAQLLADHVAACAALLNCYDKAPHRAEPLHTLARRCHAIGEFALAALFASKAVTLPYPGDARLFVDADVYAWSAWDVLAMSAWHVGELVLGREAARAASAGYLARHGAADQRLLDNVAWYEAEMKARATTHPTIALPAAAAATVAPRAPAVSTDRGLAVVIAQPPGYGHSGSFHEIAASVYSGLEALGHDVVMVYGDELPTDRRTVLLGANLLGAGVPMRADTIVYNWEQAGSHWLEDPLLNDRARRHTLWDYCPTNVEMWERRGITATLVPAGFAPCLVRVPPGVREDIDVLFMGSLNDRRSALLDELRRRGLEVRHLFGLFGRERDEVIARAKVNLNVHFYEAAILESMRCSYLFANGRAVVSEASVDVGPFDDAAVFVPYEQLADACEDLVTDEVRRLALARRAAQVMRAQKIEDVLRPVLAQLGIRSRRTP